ncbi:UNVERIFIED_CONTAM: spore coat protein SA [Acetivibrio alkalicellulosi]
MKIALICTEKLPVPPIAGGAVQLYISEILPYISKDYDITVYCKSHPSLANEETVDNVRYVRIPAKTPFSYITKVKDVLDNNFDLIHVFNRPRWVPELSESFPNTKFSLSLHNEMFNTDKIPEDKAIECINRVEFINTVSKFIADGIKNLYPQAQNKLNVVYSGVNTQKYSTNWSPTGIANKLMLKDKYGLKDKKVILHVTRLSPKKGTHIVLAATKKVMEKHPDAALFIVGSKWYGKNEDDEYTMYCRNLSNEIDGKVVFTGFIPPYEIPSLYNIGDIFVCASQWKEPLARVHYEAMGAGLPIITTDRGGNAEIFEHNVNGLIIKDYKNPDSFTDNINFLLSNPQIALELGKNARKTACDKYTWQRVADEVFAPLKSISPRPVQNNYKLSETSTNDQEIKELNDTDNFFSSDF